MQDKKELALKTTVALLPDAGTRTRDFGLLGQPLRLGSAGAGGSAVEELKGERPFLSLGPGGPVKPRLPVTSVLTWENYIARLLEEGLGGGEWLSLLKSPKTG